MVKIVAIEDEKTILHEICQTLELSGYEAFAATNGRIGLQFIHEHTPDLVISDILMPELDGYEVLKHIRQDSRYQDLPFIFLTAKTSAEEVEYGLELGASIYLTKPFTINDLLQAVEASLE